MQNSIKSDTDYSRNSDEVGILCIQPVDKSSINYFLMVVDLPMSNNLTFSYSKESYNAENQTLSINFSYNNEDPEPGTELQTHFIGVWAFQNDVNNQPINLLHVEVSGTENGNQVSKGGTYSSIKTVSNFDTPQELAEDEAQKIDKPRVIVVKSFTNPNCYGLVVCAKSVNTNSLLLGLSINEADTKQLNGSYSPNDGLFNNPNEYICAIGVFASTKNQFNKIIINRMSKTISNALYNYQSPYIL